MANSPAHKFGQDLGSLLEYIVLHMILKPRLQAFVTKKKYFLDSLSSRPTRPGKKKVCWKDKYGNVHDLDFVIEAEGTPNKIGIPVAFIEAAWRRYTKHSKNKAQEIQGAILPIVELHNLSAPFHGAILAGEFSTPALDQLKNNNFSILYIPYEKIVAAFKSINLDIEFDERTTHKVFTDATDKLLKLPLIDKNNLRNEIVNSSKDEIDLFMKALEEALERIIVNIILIPMFGSEIKLLTVDDALSAVKDLDTKKPTDKFQKVEIIVDYNNGDTIRASFASLTSLTSFLTTLQG